MLSSPYLHDYTFPLVGMFLGSITDRGNVTQHHRAKLHFSIPTNYLRTQRIDYTSMLRKIKIIPPAGSGAVRFVNASSMRYSLWLPFAELKLLSLPAVLCSQETKTSES
jgi:hypothetical protein